MATTTKLKAPMTATDVAAELASEERRRVAKAERAYCESLRRLSSQPTKTEIKKLLPLAERCGLDSKAIDRDLAILERVRFLRKKCGGSQEAFDRRAKTLKETTIESREELARIHALVPKCRGVAAENFRRERLHAQFFAELNRTVRANERIYGKGAEILPEKGGDDVGKGQ